MKNVHLLTFLFVFCASIALAQGTVDTEPKVGGFDITSGLIGLVVGLILGYLIGARMSKK
jgi:membrane associated rhomboid family serine protease